MVILKINRYKDSPRSARLSTDGGLTFQTSIMSEKQETGIPYNHYIAGATIFFKQKIYFGRFNGK
jgi:hypothetical protein